MIQYLRTGKAAHAIAVIAAWGGMDDPNKSAVIGKMGAALNPAGPMGSASSLGHWEAHIPKNIPDENAVEALDFLKWLVTKENQIKYSYKHLQSLTKTLSTVDVLSQSSTLNLENFCPSTSIRYVLHVPPTSLPAKSTSKSVS